MSNKTEYDLQREARIQRNKAMLARLQVQDSADKVAEPQRAAKAKEAANKAAARQKYVFSGPARKSSRAGAQRTKAKLQAQAGEDSEDKQASTSSQSNASDGDSEGIHTDFRSGNRKRGREEADFDPADSAEGSDGSSLEGDGDEEDDAEDSSPVASRQKATDDGGADVHSFDQDEEELQLQQALAMSLQAASGVQPRIAEGSQKQQSKANKGQPPRDPADPPQPKPKPKGHKKAERKGRKPKGKAGIQSPTAQEMKAAFALLNPSGGSVISTHDILQAGVGFGYNFDEAEVVAMMEFAASVTGRASLSSMTFQGFQKLVEHYSQTV